MKIEWNKKYTTIAIYSLIVLAIAVLFVVFIFRFDSISSGLSWVGEVAAPVICGIIIAYIFNPLMMFFERSLFGKLKMPKPAGENRVLKKFESTTIGETKVVKTIERAVTNSSAKRKEKRRRVLSRVLSLILTYLVFIAVIGGIVVAVVPNVANSVVELSDKLPDYLTKVEAFLNDFFKDNPGISNFLFEEFTDISNALQQFAKSLEPAAGDLINNFGSGVWNFVVSLFTGLKNVLLGLIISIYLLYSKEKLQAQCKKILYAFMKNKHCDALFTALGKSNKIFKRYIVSNLLDSMIVFVLMVIGMYVMGMPYQMLIASLCAVTNLIPFFGPFIGAVPSGILILLVDPSKVIWFAIFVLVLQQCDGNIVKPLLFGETTGLPAIWVLISIIVGGGLFGIPGMLLGVPVFAVIYLLFAELVSSRLKRKNLPTDTDSFMKGSDEFAEKPLDKDVGNSPIKESDAGASGDISDKKP